MMTHRARLFVCQTCPRRAPERVAPLGPLAPTPTALGAASTAPAAAHPAAAERLGSNSIGKFWP